MSITIERLRQTFSEGGGQEIYQEVKSEGDFQGFARQYAFDENYLVARNTLGGLTKASKEELSQLQVILDKFIYLSMQTENSSVRRLSLNIIERLEMDADDRFPTSSTFALSIWPAWRNARVFSPFV